MAHTYSNDHADKVGCQIQEFNHSVIARCQIVGVHRNHEKADHSAQDIANTVNQSVLANFLEDFF